MKKFNVLFTALLCASVMFVGCSDDDENDGNANGAGNGGSGVVVKSKKVVQVIETSVDGSYSEKDTTLYAYDAEGRLSKITELDSKGDDVSNITYASDKITIKYVRNSSTDGMTPAVIELKNGRAIKTTGGVSEVSGSKYKYDFEMIYSYVGNYISKLLEKNTETTNGEVTYNETDTTIILVENGNIVKVEYDNDILNMEMSSVDNNMNIDLVYGLVADIGDGATLLCVTGDRFKKLPAKETMKDGEEDYIGTYKYEVSEDGYVTKITMTSGDTWSAVYEITYE